MKNKSDKATQSPKKGSSAIKRNGRDPQGSRQSSRGPNTDRNDDESNRGMQKEQGSYDDYTRTGMSEFERGYYEGRRSFELEMRNGGYRRSSDESGSGYSRNYNEMRGRNQPPESMLSQNGPTEYNGANRNQRFNSDNSRNRTYTSQNEFDQYSRGSGFAEDEDMEYDDHEFQNRGYQGSGQVEGFGHRSGMQNGQDWEARDHYRDGNAPVRNGKGRYGSR